MYWVQYFELRSKRFAEPCGDRCVVQLDGRNSLDKMKEDAIDFNGVRRPYYRAYQIRKGDSFTRNVVNLTEIVRIPFYVGFSRKEAIKRFRQQWTLIAKYYEEEEDGNIFNEEEKCFHDIWYFKKKALKDMGFPDGCFFDCWLCAYHFCNGLKNTCIIKWPNGICEEPSPYRKLIEEEYSYNKEAAELARQISNLPEDKDFKLRRD